MRQSTKTREDAEKRETAEQLESFRRQREAADAAARDVRPGLRDSGTVPHEDDLWAAKKKRRREKDITLPNASSKVRKLSSAGKTDAESPSEINQTEPQTTPTKPPQDDAQSRSVNSAERDSHTVAPPKQSNVKVSVQETSPWPRTRRLQLGRRLERQMTLRVSSPTKCKSTGCRYDLSTMMTAALFEGMELGETYTLVQPGLPKCTKGS